MNKRLAGVEANILKNVISSDKSPLKEYFWFTRHVFLPGTVEVSESDARDYPRIQSSTILDCFNLKVAFSNKIIVQREKTYLEDRADLKLRPGEILGGKYRILNVIGKTGFSRVYSATDILQKTDVCLKIIDGNKTYFDQSIEEVKMIRMISKNCDLEKKNLLKMIDYFYCREHLVIVTELLSQNLYDYQQNIREKGLEPYFTKERIRGIAYQVLVALQELHNLNVIHCDLKPENILFQSIKDCKVKLIDFGSCSFIHDEPAFYMQTRPYRAPELLLGCQYDEKIDIWSLGCVLAELFLGVGLFECKSVSGILAKMMAVFGSFPEWMIKTGKLVKKFMTRDLLPFHEVKDERNNYENDVGFGKRQESRLEILVPKRIDLIGYFPKDDELFVDFIFKLLEVDSLKR